MADDSHGDELEDLDAALFGGGASTPAPPPEPAPAGDIDWFADVEGQSASPPDPTEAAEVSGAIFGTAAAADDAAPLFPDPGTDWMFEPESEAPIVPIGMAGDDVPPSPSAAEGPIVAAAIFGMAGDPPPQPLSRRELKSRPPADRRRRVLTLVVVVALLALVGIGVAAVATGGGDETAAKAQVKVVGTALPTTTASTRPATTAGTDGRAD